MRHSDVFVFLDDAQMPGGQSYVYRTQIRGPAKPMWLSIPSRFSLGAAILDVSFADTRWARKHVNTLRATYGRCPFFREVMSILEPIYTEARERLAAFNERMIRALAEYLCLSCRFERSSELRPNGEGDDRLVSIAQILRADTYVSGEGGAKYQDPAKFGAAGILLEVRSYTPVPYRQMQGDFEPGLSILDALFHLGRRTLNLLVYSEDHEAKTMGDHRGLR